MARILRLLRRSGGKGSELPLPTEILVAVSAFVATWWLVIIGVCTQRDNERMESFAQEKQISYPICVDITGATVGDDRSGQLRAAIRRLRRRARRDSALALRGF